MKNIFKKITAALCTGVMLFTSSAINVSAKEEDTSLMLPSGITVNQLQAELKDLGEELSGVEPVYASAALAVFQGDDVLFEGYYGKTDIENDISANADSVYEWGSISKTFIWVSAMQLWEQGKLDLDRDIREYLPDGFFQHLSYDEPITMMNLMNHNAGWQETTRSIWKNDESKILSLREELQAIEPAQIHRPGEVVAYSNYGAAVAGYVIECVSGQDYCDYVHENIFEPLGMEYTSLNPAHSDNAWVYEHRKESHSYRFGMKCIDLGSRLEYVPCYPAGAAAGKLSDMMIYAQALVNDDAPLFQNKETQEILFTGTDFYGDSDIPMCAHGFFCTEYAVRTYGHSGGTLFGQAYMMFDRESKIGYVVMVNEQEGNQFLNSMSSLVFGMLPADKYSSGTSTKKEFSGYYMQARSTHKGMMKFIPFLSAVPIKRLGEIENIGNGVYQVKFDDGTAILLGTTTFPDGSMAFQQPSSDIFRSEFYVLKLILLAVYVMLAVASVFMLLIRGKLKKHGKLTAYAGSNVMTAGQIARIASVIAWLISFIFYQKLSGGLPVAISAVIGIVQMICIAVCGISAIISSVSIFSSKNGKSHAVRHLLNTVGCVLPIITIIYFEMYMFWSI